MLTIFIYSFFLLKICILSVYCLFCGINVKKWAEGGGRKSASSVAKLTFGRHPDSAFRMEYLVGWGWCYHLYSLASADKSDVYPQDPETTPARDGILKESSKGSLSFPDEQRIAQWVQWILKDRVWFPKNEILRNPGWNHWRILKKIDPESFKIPKDSRRNKFICIGSSPESSTILKESLRILKQFSWSPENPLEPPKIPKESLRILKNP